MRVLALLLTSDSAPAKKQQRAATPPIPVSPWLNQSTSASTGPMVRRKSACGGGCPGCAHGTTPQTIQTKLQVSTPGDQYEQEAEQVAEQVMRAPASSQLRIAEMKGSSSLNLSRHSL